MTVTYSSEVTTSSTNGIGIFLKLLARWRGSIYKMVWVDLLIYLAVYYALNLLYLYGLDEHHGGRVFISVVTYFSKYGSAIPLSFVLGFYVNVVYTRWWAQYSTIPYPDNIAILVGASVPGKEEKPKMIRRTIIRYVCVAFTLTLTMISPKVKKRFPTLHHFVEAGLLNDEEKTFMEDLDKDYPTYSSKYWLPLAWAANVTTKARDEGIIHDELGVKDILEQINEFREKCKKLCDYDWICVPLVYTQVVTLAVYIYFLFRVIGTQFIEEENDRGISLFRFPLMSLIEFFFYMGWLKVAESLINPFGEDDDDFEVVWMIDRHLQVGYLLVDKIHNDHPKLTKDYHWNQTAPNQLPFTIASRKYMKEHPVESTCNVCLQKNDQDMIFTDDMSNLAEPQSTLNSVSNRFKNLFSRKKRDPAHHLKRLVVQKDTETDDEWKELNEMPANEVDSLQAETLEKCKEIMLETIGSLEHNIEDIRKMIQSDLLKSNAHKRTREDLLKIVDPWKHDIEKTRLMIMLKSNSPKSEAREKTKKDLLEIVNFLKRDIEKIRLDLLELNYDSTEEQALGKNRKELLEIVNSSKDDIEKITSLLHDTGFSYKMPSP